MMSVSALVTEEGTLTNSYRYDAYGSLISGTPDGVHYYGYNAESMNVKTGLQYLRARYYNPEDGRFVTEDDELGDQTNPLSRNRYAYVLNNPLNYFDPSGHRVAPPTSSTYTRPRANISKKASSASISSIVRAGASGDTSKKSSGKSTYLDKATKKQKDKKSQRKECTTTKKASKQSKSGVSKAVKLGLAALAVGGLTAAAIATGGASLIAIQGLIGAGIGGVSGGLQSLMFGGNVVDGVVSGILNGAVVGALGGAGVNAFLANAAGGAIGGASKSWFEGKSKKDSVITTAVSTLTQGLVGGAFGYLTNKSFVGTVSGAATAAGKAVAMGMSEVYNVVANKTVDVVIEAF